ncbi:hypothetical protein N7536_009727 [Penicillium majusculum]|uniref:Uncharacterized protein n=1 Tax=Penicillium solitum TaxID=60172 RepID=A0A1V6R500_9EURO|nr:uncharacterized protein PENSOL_c015G04047 [Penicillium solitum]KAJ5687108.1 hypothetical protein N7536_009727 [Penicillium majusculum]OQD96560.1 hypothetical protein PENSOL_c015G04047 [Penicillium solitum]
MAPATIREVLKYPKLTVKALPLPDVEHIFNLTKTEDTNWTQLRAPFEITDHCNKILSEIDAAISRSDGRPDLVIRLRLELLLDAVHAIPPSPDSTPIPVLSKSPFLFGPVVYKEKVHCLQGTPDWFLCCGSNTNKAKENVAINLVIVVTERGQSADGVSRTLAYMAMIHTQRRAEGKADCSVFGLSTDNNQFHFLQINDKSEASRSELLWSQLVLNYFNHLQEIVEKLAYFHKQASILSASDRSGETKKAHSAEDET